MNKNPFSLMIKAFAFLFGQFNWSSPPWFSYLCRKAKTSPKTFWGLHCVLLLLFIAAGYGVYWYKHLPQPLYVVAKITSPEITPNEEALIPANLQVDFGIKEEGFVNQSVAPLNSIGKTVTEGIEITPKIPGAWTWLSDSQLVFTPYEDWPAGQKYTIHFAPDFFAANANMESYEASFFTQPFKAEITDLRLYQDPVHAEIRQAVATVTFNFPVNTETLEKNTSLMFLTQKDGKPASAAEPLPFTYTFDKHKRVAYLHSDTIKLTDVARFVRFTLNKKVSSATRSGTLGQEYSENLFIPDTRDFLKVVSASAAIIRNDQDRPEQILTVETSIGINEREFNKFVHFYLLPEDRPSTNLKDVVHHYAWSNPGEVTESIRALATPLVTEPLPSEQNYATLHSFKFSAQTPRYILVHVDKGMKGFGDFTLSTAYEAVIPVPAFPKEIGFLHKGSLLALSGEKKLSVLVRGLSAVKFDFARVLPDNVNQLVTQTQGNFNNPRFINPSFNQQNISTVYSDIQQFDGSDLGKQQYTALDFSKYLAKGMDNEASGGPRGLFLLQATEWDTARKIPLDVKASRLILITDLALLVKDNSDGSHDVFVSSITEGAPVANVEVSVLGKNGLPILFRVTDAQGRVTFPSLKDFIDDKEPTVYLARLNQDVSFIPYNNANRQLNFSKFDVGGLYSSWDSRDLRAYLFSDRGIYRPGDTAHIGIIVKQEYAEAQPAGLPLQATVVDSRGTTIKSQTMMLNETGYMELDFTTNSSSPTGQYVVNLFLVKDEHPENLLGYTLLKVAEFQPDRMHITSSLSPKPSGEGWISPLGLKAQVGLWNLYGAPASNRKVGAKILLVPQKVQFKKYPDYVFVDPLVEPKKPAKVFTESLTDSKTNDKGEAEFDLHLERYDKATYQLTFFAEGFEADGGRSVTSQIQSLVSPLPYLIGYKPDGDLSFIKQNSARQINYIAINPQLNKQAIKDLKIQLVSLRPITTLVKKADGTYQYQSLIQSSIVSTTPLNVTEKGVDYSLPTQQVGDFSLNVLDKDQTVLSQLKFSVVGASQQPLAKNAELSIKLSQSEYQANEDIEIQITSPYTGTGLITIERDKVYAAQWFKTDTTNSVQRIHIPADFQGDGYINVAFIRDWGSPEIFISPLSYSVVPFKVNHSKHEIAINLQTPSLARPGEPLTINYSTDKPGKIIVFAVDEGILQVAKYITPDPLSFFFQKHALEVVTQQTVDQIMPQFIQDRELSAVGGDAGDEGMLNRLNPFKRKTDLPVVYWSGILDTDAGNHKLIYPVPDYFNGKIRVIAIAVSADSMGSKDAFTEIRGDFIISPNVPTFVAPGDEFEISASVANNVKDSGEHASVTVNLMTSSEVEILGAASHTLDIAEGHDQTVHFKLKANSLLGSANLDFHAAMGDKSGTMSSSISVRPSSPRVTYIDSGQSQDGQKSLDVLQTLYPQYHHVNATLSTSPLILVFGLQTYLDNYPYGCTEQLISKVMPLLAMNNQAGFNQETGKITKKISKTVQMLSQRQMSDGSFSYWPGLGVNQGNDFATVYAMHFLTGAKEQGFDIPGELFMQGLNYLKTLVEKNASNMDTARIQAYAIYILTRNELVTSNYLAHLHAYLEKNRPEEWKKDIISAYLAASYQLLQSHDEANRLIGLYQPQKKLALTVNFYNSSIADAQYLYIVAKYFPNLLPQVSDTVLMRLIQAINRNEINTILSGYISLALGAYSQNTSIDDSATLSMTQIMSNNQKVSVPVEHANYQKAVVDTEAKQIRFDNPKKEVFFYQLIQSGFDKTLPKVPLNKRIEIFREYRDAQGHVIQSAALGSEIEVHIQIRALDNDYLANIAIEDLLPGGFEVVSGSIKKAGMDYSDSREDRVNFFGSISSSAQEIIYKIKAINVGTYTVPPAYAESMYDPNILARGVVSEITVLED